MGQSLKRNQNSISTALGREGVQGCACHDGGCSERSSGCWGFDAVMWNGWGKKGLQFPSLSHLHPYVTPLSSVDPHRNQTHHLTLHLSPHVCHPSHCLDHLFSFVLHLVLLFSLNFVLCLCFTDWGFIVSFYFFWPNHLESHHVPCSISSWYMWKVPIK